MASPTRFVRRVTHSPCRHLNLTMRFCVFRLAFCDCLRTDPSKAALERGNHMHALYGGNSPGKIRKEAGKQDSRGRKRSRRGSWAKVQQREPRKVNYTSSRGAGRHTPGPADTD